MLLLIASAFATDLNISRIVPPTKGDKLAGIDTIELALKGEPGVQAALRRHLKDQLARGAATVDDSVDLALKEGLGRETVKLGRSDVELVVNLETIEITAQDVGVIAGAIAAVGAVVAGAASGGVEADDAVEVAAATSGCISNQAAVKAVWKLRRGDEVLDEGEAKAAASDEVCGDTPLSTDEELAREATIDLAKQIAREIAPRWRKHVIPLADHRDVRQGIKLAKAGELDLARCAFRGTIHRTKDKSAEARYNLGAVFEALGYNEKAGANYGRAKELGYDPAGNGLKRIDKRERQLKLLDDGWSLDAVEVEEERGRCMGGTPGTLLIVTKTTHVRKRPNEDAEVILKIKKKNDLTVVSRKKGWYEVEWGEDGTAWINAEHAEPAGLADW